ncbi:hypothetical protein [Flavobacterium sp. ZB4P13]|jgi:hypothetical protein|uniref:hypothetical protein n=1 Tax=Flavobacterium sp. ZB4P13 TaxID=3401728 RepID=UPI003AB03064
MKSKITSFENFKKNTILKSQLLTIFGGDAGPEKPGTGTSSSSGAGATIVKLISNPLPVLGQKI